MDVQQYNELILFLFFFYVWVFPLPLALSELRVVHPKNIIVVTSAHIGIRIGREKESVHRIHTNKLWSVRSMGEAGRVGGWSVGGKMRRENCSMKRQ